MSNDERLIETLDRLEARLAALQALVEQIALGLGIKLPG